MRMVHVKALERDEERVLIAAAKRGDQRAQVRLINQFAPMVRGWIRKRRSYGIDAEDLEQEGAMAILRAIEGFDLENRDNRFSTYLMWWVRAFVDEYVVRNWCAITIKGANGKTKWNALREFSAAVGRPASFDDTSPDRRPPEPVDTSGTPEQICLERDERAWNLSRIHMRLARLNDRERDVVVSRWLTDPPLKLEELGQKYGISRERVRQIESRALAKMGLNRVPHSKKLEAA